jgi:hypothetical protein
VACNPEPGNWIWDRFAKLSYNNELPKEFHYLSATTNENPYLPPDYVPTLLQSYPEELIKRYIEGKWEVYEGQIYPEFNRVAHVIRPFDIPSNWERVVAIDHGLVNPTCALWGAIDFDGNIFIYDEYYNPGIVSQHAKEIIRKSEKQNISLWIIDPSTAAKTREKEGMPWSVLEEYNDYGIFPIPANNEKLAGINRVKEFLKFDSGRVNPITEEHPSPRLFIFSSCTNTVWEMPQYRWKKLRSLLPRSDPEQPQDTNDHAMDSLRYLIMSRFPAPIKRTVGADMVQRTQRQKVENMLAPFEKNFEGDEIFGKFGDTLGVNPNSEGGSEWKQ